MIDGRTREDTPTVMSGWVTRYRGPTPGAEISASRDAVMLDCVEIHTDGQWASLALVLEKCVRQMKHLKATTHLGTRQKPLTEEELEADIQNNKPMA